MLFDEILKPRAPHRRAQRRAAAAMPCATEHYCSIARGEMSSMHLCAPARFPNKCNPRTAGQRTSPS
eukprot:5822742-Pyramimonas_sp.AAC.1